MSHPAPVIRIRKGLAGQLSRRPAAGTLLETIVVYTFFAALGGANFVGTPGWSSFLNMVAEFGIVALAVGLLMIAGELDISVGAVLPAASLTVAITAGQHDLPTWVGIIAGLSVGFMVGLLNGLLVTRTTIPSLIITIGTMFGTMGLTLGLTVLIAGSTGVFKTPDPSTNFYLANLSAACFRSPSSGGSGSLHWSATRCTSHLGETGFSRLAVIVKVRATPVFPPARSPSGCTCFPALPQRLSVWRKPSPLAARRWRRGNPLSSTPSCAS
jgi:hypothetical protein